MFRFFFSVLLIFCLTGVLGQDYAKKIDSLNNLLPALSHEDLSKSLNKISEYSTKLSKALAYQKANETLLQARNNRQPLAEFLAIRNLSRIHAYHLDQTGGLHFIQEGLSFARQEADSFTLALAYFHTAEFYEQQQLLSTALENLLEASSLFSALKDHRYEAECNNMAATIHYKARNYIQAIEEAEKVVAHYRGLKPFERTGEDDFQAMSIYNTLGLSYFKTRNYTKSLEYYGAGEEMAKKLTNNFWVGLINGNRAVVYYELKLYDKALQSLNEDFYASKKYDQNESAVRAATKMAEIHMTLGNTATAQQYLDSCLLLISNLNRHELHDYWRIDAQLKKNQGNLEGAFTALERYTSLKDSSVAASESFNLTKVKASYDLERKQQEIEALALKDEQNNARIKLQKTILIASAVIVLLLVALIIVYVFSVRRLKEINKLIKRQHQEIEYKNEELEAQSIKLKEANELTTSLNSQLEQKVLERTHELEMTLHELDTFLYRSSHDIRRPLSTLLGLENVAKLQTDDKEILSIFEMVGETVRHMDSMLLKLQMAYELAQHSIEFDKVPVAEIVFDQAEKFRKRLSNGGIEVDINTKMSIPLFSNAKLFTIIIKNLLENAVNFRKSTLHEKLLITIQVRYLENHLQLVVSDNGVGIEDAYLPRIFDQYFKGTQSSKGNGLGLYLVQKALDKLKGSIQVVSEFEKGSSFMVTLPYTPNQ